MKFTLMDYQEDAVQVVLVNLQKARKRWREDGDKHAFSLTATTGAGKTVMAAAVLEALFHGNEEYGFEPDRGAVVVWFSDDPSLNQQSLNRLMEASDRLHTGNLCPVEYPFNRDRLEAGKVYFLNTQKLGKGSLLVRGADADEAGIERDGRQLLIMPDLQCLTFWDILQNTIEDPALTLYLVLDEAHRGMKTAASRDKPTIVKRLINGQGAVPGIPVVLGISATVERFNTAMAEMKNHITMPNVVVDAAKVQASGLLKDTIVLDIPDEAGEFCTVLLRRGVNLLRESSEAWARYAERQDPAAQVLPLMVFQVPNAPDPNDIGKAIDTIMQAWPELRPDAFAHVFGEHATLTFGRHTVPYIAPERVQGSRWVRVLIAKDAISTGWDCPRAEVMVSFRPARDKTHIIQLLGRMIRSPLARRIPGNERLNSVNCLLPFFDKDTVESVVRALLTGGEDEPPPPGRRVLIDPREMTPNPAVPEAVWEKLLTLPSQSIPKRQSQPVKRLSILAHELARDGLLPDGGKKAHAELHKVLDGLRARYAGEIEAARKSVLKVEGKTIKSDLEGREMLFDDFVESADYAVIEEAYRRAARGLSGDLAKTYARVLANTAPGMDALDNLVEAQTTIAALGLVPEIGESLAAEAEKLANQWLNHHRIPIKNLPDARQEVYRQIREMSAEPQDIELARPRVWMQPTTLREVDGSTRNLPRFERHLLCDEEGLFPEDFGSWESEVILTELRREGTIAWYRNPSRTSQDSLGITYVDGGETKILRPDFIFFTQLPDGGSIVADMVDPHGIHLSDALPKLRGLARYAEVNRAFFRRIEAVAKMGETFRVLDLMEASVRQAIAGATSIKSLYLGEKASDYK